ncbi:hypothetical protein N7470_009513 [Penicillium chermesinum]|nr:hypothetical protein N7470_009513 [Penicillium chermesinum]
MPEDNIRDWPTVVLEVGYSESRGKLKCDAAWWLANSNRAVKLITIDCIVLNRSTSPTRYTRSRYRQMTRQQLTITRDQNGCHITIQEIMARSPLPGETDIRVPVPHLEEFVADIWFRQGL